MKNILKSTKLIIVVMCVFMLCTGVVFGSFMDIKTQVNSNTGSYYQINEKQNSYKVVSTTDIAVVNLDEGVNLKDKKTYYAGKIITLPNEHFHMTGLDNARNGLKSGEYGAYIVIPATFSKSVESINNDPEKATIKYTINADNNDASLASIVNDINSFASIVSENITFIYVSAILEEYHRAQDNTKLILKNDIIDLNNINNISPESLLGIYENVKENSMDYNPLKIDINKYEVENENIVDLLSRELKEAKIENERDFNNIKKESEEVRAGTIKIQKFFEEITPLKDNSGNSIYSNGLVDVERSIADHNEIVNTSFILFDEIFKRQNEQTKNIIQQEANIHLASESNAMRNRLNLEINYTLANSYRRAFEDEYQNIQRDSMERMRGYIENVIVHELVMENEERDYLLSKLATASDAILNNNINTATMSNAVNVMVRNDYFSFDVASLNAVASNDFNDIKARFNFPMDQFKDTFRNEIEDVIENAVANLVMEINEKASTLNEDQTRYLSVLEDYNPYEHLNDSYIQRATNELQRSAEYVLSEFEKKQMDDEKQVYDILRITDENMRLYDESIYNANEATMKNVIDVVNELRSKKEITKSENTGLMKDFSDKLSYTRIGNIGNKETYNFISSPIEISPNEDSNIEVKSDYIYNKRPQKPNMMDNRYIKGAISIGGISFVLLVALVLNALFNKTEKNMM